MGIVNSSKPIAVELILIIDSCKTDSIFDDVTLLCTINTPPWPLTLRTACNESTNPVPWVNTSFCKSVAVDIKMFFTSWGANDSDFSSRLCITSAALPATIGAAMLVPPNKLNDSLVESSDFCVTADGVKLYAPILIKSGFGSPIILGPLLEKSTTWSECIVVFPNLGSSLNGS